MSTATPSPAAPPTQPRRDGTPNSRQRDGRRSTELDARGRTPPNPLVGIRAAIEELREDDVLHVRTREEPVAFALALASPSLAVAANRLPDHSWRLTLQRRAP